MGMKAITVEVSKLSPKPGDILAIRCDRIMSMEQRKTLLNELKGIAPDGVKIVVLDGNLDLKIVESPNT
jgi:hypothetical protein